MPHCEVLANGLKAVLVPCEAESVAVGIFVASGSRHETARTAGISHFIEHMLFKGTPTRKPVDIARAIEGRGGHFNACTGEESTCYYAQMPCEYLAEALDILSDMYLRATIPPEEFAREKQVVIEEIRMYADEPDAVAAENLQKNLFRGSQLGEPVAGSAGSLGPMTPELMHRYLRSHYRADNTIVVIAGAFDPRQAVRLVDKHLGKLRGRGARSGKDAGIVRERFQPVRHLSSVGRDIQQAQLALGYRTFGVGDRRKYAATVLDAILGRGMSSRLFNEVRERRGLSYDISSRMQFFQDAGMFTISAGLDPAKRELALKTVDRELERICKVRVSAAELKRTKEFLTGNFRLGHEKVVSKMFYYGSTMLAFNRLVDPKEQVEKVAAVTAADIQSVAKSIFKSANRSVSWVLPASMSSTSSTFLHG